MSFLEVANSKFVYIVCGIALVIVTIILLNFMRIAFSRAKEIGVTKSKIKTTIRTTILVSIGPAMSILIPLIVMMKLLGKPWSWLRLSVVGSATMEMLLADNALATTGFGGLTDIANLSDKAFGVIVMSVGIAVSAGILLNVFLNKRFSRGFEDMKKGNSVWTSILIAALFGGFMVNFGAGAVVNDGYVAMAVFFTTLGLAALIDQGIKKFEIKGLKEYAFAIELVLGMASAVLWFNVL